ncbi:uncharacterized protein LOC110189700 isoform X1 [Drosophila serrata]|uniref:uncharacterized protein LOC110189681 isoform X1 n=1 Tax=Drosophila serrata TaxID=7274 RepID=UPI000A1D1F15|nr:uncharacterized protein LOC110189681 isoform X1 [Drosophila serrata]XP_020815533.1 uncharacterized protein LOC110189700 isoform X1 [Drosophila serrata]
MPPPHFGASPISGMPELTPGGLATGPSPPRVTNMVLGANSSTERTWPQPGMRLHQGCLLLGTDNVGGGEAFWPPIGHDWLTRNFPSSTYYPCWRSMRNSLGSGFKQN